MSKFRKHIRKVLWVSILLFALLITGCAGIEPYEPRNNREEGPEKGLFSGSEGEFVIFRKADEPESGSKDRKSTEANAEDEKQILEEK